MILYFGKISLAIVWRTGDRRARWEAGTMVRQEMARSFNKDIGCGDCREEGN